MKNDIIVGSVVNRTAKKMAVIILGTVLAAGTLLFTGCNRKQDTGESSSESSSQVVNIGTMNLVNGDLIAQYEKYYEEELGVEVNLVTFDSGKDVNTALAAGSIDISELGSSPTALGISNGVDYQVVWIGDIIGSAESLVATNDSGIESIEDLKGKKIATPFASTAHYSLLNALRLAGVSESEVTLLDLQPADIYAAWTRGDIDAAYVWYPVLSQLLENGKTITGSDELAGQGVITADLTVVRTEYAKENPDVVTNYIKAQIKANDVLLNNSETAAEEIAELLEIATEDAADQITQFLYLTVDEQLDYLKNTIAPTLKSTADFLVEQDSIKFAPELSAFESAVNTEFIEEAVK